MVRERSEDMEKEKVKRKKGERKKTEGRKGGMGRWPEREREMKKEKEGRV